MTRQTASVFILRNILVVFLLFFLVFALLNTSLSFIYQPLFSALITVPTFTTLALFALIMALVIRQNCVMTVPDHTVGVVRYSNGVFKTLVPAGPAWVWFGRERISEYLSLEPVSAHLPLLGLKANDGTELEPPVTIITWRIHDSITSLLSSRYGWQVMEVAEESQMKRERRVRERVAEVLRRRVAAESVEALKEYLSNIHTNHFGQEIIAEVNRSLTLIGLRVDRLECIGSIVSPIKAPAALKTISAARKKLERLLRPRAGDAPIQAVQKQADQLLEHARQAVVEMRAVGRATDAYVQVVITMLEEARQHFQKQASTARQAQREELAQLSARITMLLEAANRLRSASEEIEHAPFYLTSEELTTLFKVLDAIEHKKLPLGTLFP